MEVLRIASVDRTIELLNGGTGTVRTVFKGGTSLSRVYRLIDRFSEDIDLLITFPTEGDGPSNSARDRLLKLIASEVLSHISVNDDDSELLTSTKGVKRYVKYHYPLRAAPHAVLSTGVTLEMGSRGGTAPMEQHSLRSIIANYAIGTLGDSEDLWEEFTAFQVNVLGAERTLLEKLSAVHSITSRADSIQSAPAGWGRHFYDIHQLLQSEDVRAKLVAIGPEKTRELIHDIEDRSIQAGFAPVQRPPDGFASSPAFDRDGSAALEIRRAYKAVEGLIYGPVPPIEDCLGSVHQWSQLL
ncbi:MAG: nucleotidyl transferase AbiEii/AbiGii toxin family protein [Mycobacterium sp.]